MRHRCAGDRRTLSFLRAPSCLSSPSLSLRKHGGGGRSGLLGRGSDSFLSPLRSWLPLCWAGREGNYDSEARRGEHSGLMSVLIKSWSPARDSIRWGLCVCARTCTRTGEWGALGDRELLTHPVSFPPSPQGPALPLFCWKSLLLPVLRPPAGILVEGQDPSPSPSPPPTPPVPLQPYSPPVH